MNRILKKSRKFILFIIVPLFIPIFIRDVYNMHILVMILINILLASSFRLIMTVGQVSFGHNAFMAIGAYTSTLLVMKMGLSFWASLFPVIIISAIIAILFGYPTLRIKGVYFFIASLAFGQIAGFALTYWEMPFGGVAGIRNIPRPTPLHIGGYFNITFSSHINYYYLVLIFVFITMGIMVRMERSRIIKIFKAIEDQDILAEAIGINLRKYKLLAFTIGSIVASIAGSLFAFYIRFISPETFNVMIGVDILVYVMLGGRNSVFGPVIGAIIMTILSERVTRVAQLYEPMVYGLILMIIMYFLPNGLSGLWKQIADSKRIDAYKKTKEKVEELGIESEKGKI